MDNKVTTHHRFIQKFERDLKAHYDAGDDTRFLKTFSKYTELSEPSELAEEMLYETLLRAQRPGELVDYSLEQMNNGDGDYETHMVYMLQALSDMGNYEEVLEFSGHLLEEPIPQGFRVDILSLRQNAANKLRGMLTEAEPAVSKDDFDKMNLFQQLEFVEKITQTHDLAYMNLIMEVFSETGRNELQTAMLLYLRSVRANGTLTIEKCGVEMTVKPSGLSSLEEYFIVRDVLPKVIDEVEQFNPSFTEAATELIMGHAIYMYPVQPDFTTEAVIKAYAERIEEMLGMPASYGAETEVKNWLAEIELDIARNSL
ncbi:hypothetical protein GCM10007275_02570 [Jeotgalicoccus coquinae]|uniref:DUF3196 domain-containing protein n=1 Tax=Jeotgalicoccus coquinae TaxID=709509 RepID=A0A6V7R8X6_9STAP|nr:hypothetical protein [Jeotgalicoccus coquinae]MBB6423077.1 hypothetical protein [Jeotgalicoccus coquinae]GGE10845.1 hypothetical protein GCM10007275_02570 [Jeotgalicoccus coquinae]CAD2073458.1 hypothetical protein JEOCOQ751_00607 [Jeotgalicoccus coquinae]